ncbi:MAG: hypothetical protein Q9M91_05025 [Candidatus Dojkabacteria bacterium]|nr:hypothetical protein [Candidatus Dojkabacteria bacterium]MDQ7021169.1 hypothetical protein [Candidatus Dojkabacteria bacterium]
MVLKDGDYNIISDDAEGIENKLEDALNLFDPIDDNNGRNRLDNILNQLAQDDQLAMTSAIKLAAVFGFPKVDRLFGEESEHMFESAEHFVLSLGLYLMRLVEIREHFLDQIDFLYDISKD